METKQRIGNKVTDRAMVQVNFCSIFHFPFSLCSFPILVASVSMSLFRMETSGGITKCILSSFLRRLLKWKQKHKKTPHILLFEVNLGQQI